MSRAEPRQLPALPSRGDLNGAYFELRSQIDQVVSQARAEGSLQVALSGLNSIRHTLDSLSRLAGFDRQGTQVNVAVQTNVNVDLAQIAERVIQKFDHEPELKARIAQALMEVMMMSKPRELAYRIDPALWVRQVLGVEPMPWQEQFLRAPQGASIIALTARQVGKTTAAAWAIAHYMVFQPGGLSVIAATAQYQSAEAVRRVRDILIKVGVELKSDNVHKLELKNGSRVLALPGSDDSIRGLTVDGWIIADEAARLDDDLIGALRPMRARRPKARFAMLSTAWSRSDPFWNVWAGDDPSWLRLKATVETVTCFSEQYLAQERRAHGENGFNREYLGIPGGGEASPFTWELYDRATRIQVPVVRPGRAFGPPIEDVNLWPYFQPQIIAHDVGRSRDRSTAVVGGLSPFGQNLLGIRDVEELPQNLSGHQRASALGDS